MTRLIWVILFAVIIGLLAIFTIRGLQQGTNAALGAEDLDKARRELEHRYPRAYFTVRLLLPAPKVRNLMVTVRPGPYVAELDAMLDRVQTILDDELDLGTYDTLKLLVADSLARTLPLR